MATLAEDVCVFLSVCVCVCGVENILVFGVVVLAL